MKHSFAAMLVFQLASLNAHALRSVISHCMQKRAAIGGVELSPPPNRLYTTREGIQSSTAFKDRFGGYRYVLELDDVGRSSPYFETTIEWIRADPNGAKRFGFELTTDGKLVLPDEKSLNNRIGKMPRRQRPSFRLSRQTGAGPVSDESFARMLARGEVPVSTGVDGKLDMLMHDIGLHLPDYLRMPPEIAMRAQEQLSKIIAVLDHPNLRNFPKLEKFARELLRLRVQDFDMAFGNLAGFVRGKLPYSNAEIPVIRLTSGTEQLFREMRGYAETWYSREGASLVDEVFGEDLIPRMTVDESSAALAEFARNVGRADLIE